MPHLDSDPQARADMRTALLAAVASVRKQRTTELAAGPTIENARTETELGEAVLAERQRVINDKEQRLKDREAVRAAAEEFMKTYM